MNPLPKYNWFVRAIRKMTARCWRHEISCTEGIAVLEEFHAEPGKMEVSIKNRPELQQYIALIFGEMIANSPNYTEMNFDLVKKGPDTWQWMTIIVQKRNGLTPHQLRLKAESALARMRVDFQKFCRHPNWKKDEKQNVLYAAGEDGAFGYVCEACGKIAHMSDDHPPKPEDDVCQPK